MAVEKRVLHARRKKMLSVVEPRLAAANPRFSSASDPGDWMGRARGYVHTPGPLVWKAQVRVGSGLRGIRVPNGVQPCECMCRPMKQSEISVFDQ